MAKQKKESPVRARMKEFLARKQMSEATLENSIGMSSGWVSNIGDSIRVKSLKQLANVYPDLNITWLTSGIGSMLVSDQTREEAKFISQFPNDDESSSTNDRYLYANDGSIGMKVSIVPAKVQAGYLRGYPDPEYYDGFEYVIIPVDRHHSGEYLGFEVVGNSMVCLDTEELAEQSIFPGRIAVGRSLSKHQWAYKLHTHNYDNWIIAHKTEGILIKQIAKHDVENGTITIHSLNPEYEDELLHLDDIEQIFSVVQIVKKTR